MHVADAPPGRSSRGYTKMINRNACKVHALTLSRELRNGKFTRISAEFLDDIESMVRNRIEHTVRTAPSMGKTLYSPTHGSQED
jgi:hypothetical protein